MCVHKKTGGERLYAALTTMLSCHHFEANLWDRKVETPEDQCQCCWWNTVLPCSSQERHMFQGQWTFALLWSTKQSADAGHLCKDSTKRPQVRRFFPRETLTNGGRYQRATSSPAHLLLQWEMGRVSFNSDGADKVTFFRYFDPGY